MKEMIVAVGLNNEIGKDNQLLWKQKSDMKHFVKITTGKNVVMGRKTFESLKAPLKNRKNYVLSNQIKKAYVHKNGAYVQYLTLNEFIDIVDDYVVIGGANVYKQFVDVVDTVYLTIVFNEYSEADSYFDGLNSEDFSAKVIDTHWPDENNENFAIVYELKRLDK